ncbi:ubiquinol-cytochrome c reductase complex assembly factor 4 [Trichomycterus rosablanca]|uniref:ubiquinol-cytochrome c reductase complex assembly factor 4 n=1 Tax=Trichomycterus rosablanca TaxID=2290929 RepID=UPI002F34F605
MSTVGRLITYYLPRSLIIRPSPARPFSLTSHRCAKSRRSNDKEENGEDVSQPIKFSTSRASHREWKVERSMGSRFQRPWWKVLPLSILCISFLIWCGFRPESDVDRALEKQLFEHLPGLLTNIEDDETTETEELKKDPNGQSK